MMKRVLAFILALTLCCALLPAGSAFAAEPETEVPTQADYAAVDAIFDRIDSAEANPPKKDATQSDKTEAAIALVTSTDSYVAGSLERSGDVFTWWTDSGIRCMYNPRMRELQKNMTSEEGIDEIVNDPIATKGGSPSGKQVYLVGPYYGYDENFSDQYKTEARRVAQAIGDADGYTLYSGKSATIDKVAEAVSNGAVVFFDSHGATDYENPNNEYDFITGASGSWLCLTSNSGLTTADYNDGAAYGDGTTFVNGEVIANHMTKDSPNGMVWMAICFGMGTDTMYKPLRSKGVEVVYGYSESVTFAGDYLFEETFWEQMTQGKTVAESIATMKSTWGEWDWSTKIANAYGYYDGYSTISAARAEFAAFPWVISSEDLTHPGRRTGSNYGADARQTVVSTYTLGDGSETIDPIPSGESATISFSNLSNRTEQTTAKQVWKQNGITVTNLKAASSTNVAYYYNPARFYTNSSLSIEYPNMVKFVADCYSADYAKAFLTAIPTNVSATVSGQLVTVQLSAATDCFHIPALSGGQVRMNSITVYPANPALLPILKEDTQVNMQLSEDLYVDLAGYSLSGTIVTNGYKVYCKDSSTDDYRQDNLGYFTCQDEHGDPVVPETLYFDGENYYLAVSDENGYSFHRFFLGITYMSLTPQVIGLGYKAEYHADLAVTQLLDPEKAFTFRLQLEGYNPVYRHYNGDTLSVDSPLELRIRNYAVQTHGEHNLCAQVSMHLQDGTTIDTEEVSLTFRWLAEQIDANYASYTDAQLTSFQELLAQFDVVETWDLPHLFPVSETPVTLDFSNVSNRLSWSSSQQIWSQNGITLTNNKASSTVDIADFAPIRLYAGSQVIINCKAMTRLVFDCTNQSSKYITALYQSLCTISGATVTQEGSLITVQLPIVTDSVTFTMTAQGRTAKLTVYRT